MSVTFGPSSFWLRTKESVDFYAVRCPVGTTLGDGSSLFCKTGGRAWIAAPSITQACSSWAEGKYNNIDVPGTEICCLSEWTTLCTKLITCGFNPCDWFVPNLSQLQSSYNCICNFGIYFPINHWSSTETNSSLARAVDLSTNCSSASCFLKTCIWTVRAFRCVTY